MNESKTEYLDYAATMLHQARTPLVMAQGQGSYIWDSHGTRYLDFVQGWAVNALGHSHPAVVEAITQQSASLMNPGPAFFSAPAANLCQRLAKLSGLEGQVFLGATGAEANEGAIKLVRKWAQRKRPAAFEIISTHGAFHGRTLATMACSGKPGWQDLFLPAMPGFVKVAYGDAQAMSAAITSQTAALMVEPIQGEAGVVVPPHGYLAKLRRLADAHGILLVFDEVQTGVGRTGKLFAYEHEAVQPDIVTLGKGLGGGLPLSALIAAPSACAFEPGDQGGTFSGNPVLAAAAHAVLNVVAQPTLLAEVERKGQLLAAGLTEASRAVPGAYVRGRGLLLALVLPGIDTKIFADKARHAGLLLNAPQPHVLRVCPALNVSHEEIEHAVHIVADLCAKR